MYKRQCIALCEAVIEYQPGRAVFSTYAFAAIRNRIYNCLLYTSGLERTAHGLYMSKEAWPDALDVLQVRYPKAVFSHETALYLSLIHI